MMTLLHHLQAVGLRWKHNLYMIFWLVLMVPSTAITQTSESEILEQGSATKGSAIKGSATKDSATASELMLPVYPPLETFEKISLRPLFHANRRPKPSEDPITGGDQEELMASWRLVGVVLTDDTPLALFAERKGEKKLKLTVGMPLDQRWVVTEIGNDFVALDGGDEQARFKLWQPREQAARGAAKKQKAKAKPTPTLKKPGSVIKAPAEKPEKARQGTPKTTGNGRTKGG